jgi:hypothetical protein
MRCSPCFLDTAKNHALCTHMGPQESELATMRREQDSHAANMRAAEAAAAVADLAKQRLAWFATEQQRRRAMASALHATRTSAFTCDGCPCPAPPCSQAARSPQADRQAAAHAQG